MHIIQFSELEGQTLRTLLSFFQVEKNGLSIYFETVKFCFLNNSLKTQFKEKLQEIAMSLVLVRVMSPEIF